MSVRAERKINPPERVIITTQTRRLKSELATDAKNAGITLSGLGEHKLEGDVFASIPVEELAEWCQLTLEMIRSRA